MIWERLCAVKSSYINFLVNKNLINVNESYHKMWRHFDSGKTDLFWNGMIKQHIIEVKEKQIYDWKD